jgi:hypothetical protein
MRIYSAFALPETSTGDHETGRQGFGSGCWPELKPPALPEHSDCEHLVLLVVVHDPSARQGHILAGVAAHQLRSLALKGAAFSRQALLGKPWRSFGHRLHVALCTTMPTGNQPGSWLAAESKYDRLRTALDAW